MLTSKHSEIPVTEVQGRKEIHLNELNPFELFDLLFFVKGMKEEDFDTGQLMQMERDPELEAYDQFRENREEQ